MVRRGPASVYRRKSSSKRIVEDRPDRLRPPPCMPDEMIRLFGYPALPSANAAADRRVREAGVLTFGLPASGHGLSTVT